MHILKNSTSDEKMFLKRLEIICFRKLKNVIIEFESPIEAFIGTNNSGKTSLLMAVKFVFYIMRKWMHILSQQIVDLSVIQDYLVACVGETYHYLFPNDGAPIHCKVHLGNINSFIEIIATKERQCTIAFSQHFFHCLFTLYLSSFLQ